MILKFGIFIYVYHLKLVMCKFLTSREHKFYEIDN